MSGGGLEVLFMGLVYVRFFVFCLQSGVGGLLFL